MWRQHDLFARQEWMVRRQRLDVVHVDARAAEMPGVEGLHESRCIDDGAARRVDEQGAAFHQADLARADHAARLVGQLDVDADDVGGLQKVVERNEGEAELQRAISRRIEGPGVDVHADGVGESAHLRADGAGAEDAEGLAVQEDIVGRLPDAAAKLRGLKADAPRGGQHQRQGMLGDDRSGQAGNIADDDAKLFGDGDVDGVGADAAHGDHPQARQLPQQMAGPLHRAA